MKRISKIVIYYIDGTFKEIINYEGGGGGYGGGGSYGGGGYGGGGGESLSSSSISKVVIMYVDGTFVEIPNNNAYIGGRGSTDIWKQVKYEDFLKRCYKCHIDLSNAMCYSCPNPNCPCGLGPVMC